MPSRGKNEARIEMEKEYSFKKVEEKWQAIWDDSGIAKRDLTSSKEGYCIMMPPPNVTGVLHMGHLLNNTLQDILIRRARQQGKSAFWQAGTDHAGISLQVKVQKELEKKGISPKSLSRKEFLEYARQWRDDHRNIILNQLKHLGVSCDFSSAVHTLDSDYARTVLQGFVELFHRGYIYRGKRMINWCPVSQTALSDEEVLMQPRKSKLYKMRYEIIEKPGTYIEICTTRPETIMGDVAVAVHPEDERYQSLIGLHCRRPFPEGELEIIADESVERDFGTGALKITPAHDPVDFEVGQRHHLPIIDIMNPDGTLNGLAGREFDGMDRFEAREKAAQKLQEMGLLIEVQDYENNVGISERSGVPIEPRISEQWFLKYPQVDLAQELAKSGKIRFFPQRWQKTYLHWLENIRDWCISRQLYWGHRIPVWYKKGEDRQNPQNWHVSVDGPADPENWEQDPDVLDTWFSSAFWPMGTLGWPDMNSMTAKGFEKFFPTAVLVTGPDILFFWVARMIMMALEFLPNGKNPEQSLPFKDVYLTGIIRDEKGRKMSKSLGNSPEPLDLIAKYGADGLRFGLLAIAPQGQDVLFSEERIEQGRNFCTKLWNAARFRGFLSEKMSSKFSIAEIVNSLQAKELSKIDQAILCRLKETMAQVEQLLNAYEFNAALQALERFFWSDYCDWYVEASKLELRRGENNTVVAVHDIILYCMLQLLHPFIPFITEELFVQLGYGQEGHSIQEIPLLTPDELERMLLEQGISLEASTEKEISQLREVVSQLRALKAQFGLSANKSVQMTYVAAESSSEFLAAYREMIMALVGMADLSVAKTPGKASVVTVWGTFSLELAGMIDVDKEVQRIQKEIEQLKNGIRANESKLQNEDFVRKAPAKVIEGARKMLAENQLKLSNAEKILAGLR